MHISFSISNSHPGKYSTINTSTSCRIIIYQTLSLKILIKISVMKYHVPYQTGFPVARPKYLLTLQLTQFVPRIARYMESRLQLNISYISTADSQRLTSVCYCIFRYTKIYQSLSVAVLHLQPVASWLEPSPMMRCTQNEKFHVLDE